jgi:hypothetical protein
MPPRPLFPVIIAGAQLAAFGTGPPGLGRRRDRDPDLLLVHVYGHRRDRPGGGKAEQLLIEFNILHTPVLPNYPHDLS